MKKKIIIMVLILAFSSQTAFASILGSVVEGWNIQIAQGTTLRKTSFMSDQSGVGMQTEYYAEYTPNAEVRPVVVTGESIWGSRTIMQAIDYMNENNMRPMLGINASFFSFQTGIPMGHVITNGEITSKDGTTLAGVGFREDGTAFMGDLGIYSTATFGEYIVEIPHINKYLQSSTQVLNLYTDAFGSNTKAQTDTINIILKDPDSMLTLGGTTTAVVEDILYLPGGADIPPGKMVLSLNMAGNQWILTLLQTLEIGQTVTIKNEATQDAELWNTAYNGLASEGKRLVKDGQIQSGFEAGAAPRTAVGITGSGSVIFYVLDGRQNGYSYGAKQETIAKRMLELGCVDALNLDGGGSTTIAGVYPGSDAASVINSPSEGTLRRVSNFIFLQGLTEQSGQLGALQLEPYTQNILIGSEVQLGVKAVDSGFYPMEVPAVEYSVDDGKGTISPTGVLKPTSEGEVTVRVQSGDVTGSATYICYDRITSMNVLDKVTGSVVEQISAPAGSVIELTAEAYAGVGKLASSPSGFIWEVAEGDFGTVDNGVLTLSEYGGSGVLAVSAGGMAKWISVEATGGAPQQPAETSPPQVIPEEVPEEPVEDYPYSEISVSDNILTVDMYSHNEPLDTAYCAVTVDGTVITGDPQTVAEQVDERHYVVKYPLTEGFMDGYHKVTVAAALTNGNSSFDVWSSDNSGSLVNPYGDTAEHWARDTISYMSEMGVVNGIIEGGRVYFKPDDNMTRAEFAVMMGNYLKTDAADYADVDLGVFADSASIPQWAQDSVKAMYALEIINGSEDGGQLYFNPNNPISRVEMMAIIARILPEGMRHAALGYADKNSIPQWAMASVQILADAGLVNGYEDGTIRPNNKVTRAEAVTMLFHVF